MVSYKRMNWGWPSEITVLYGPYGWTPEGASTRRPIYLNGVGPMRRSALTLALPLVLGACSMDPEPTAMHVDDPWSVPASWEVEERDLRFESDGVQLAGTLHSPVGVEGGPALVIVQQTNILLRDFPLYASLIETFNAIGYSVFVYDRRGHGESEGDPGFPGYMTLAEDAVAAKRAIGEEDAVDAGKVGFWGISQGGWLAMEAAVIGDPAFVVSVAAPLTTPGEQMEYLAHNYVLAAGYGEEAAQRALEVRRLVAGEYYRGEISYDSARSVVEEVEEEPWFEHLQMSSADDLTENVEERPWIEEVDYDPVPAFKGVEAPMLFIQGGEDIDVPVERTLEVAEEADSGEDVEVVVIPGANHGMRILEDPSQNVEPLNDQVPSYSIKYFMVMGEWLGRLGLA